MFGKEFHFEHCPKSNCFTLQTNLNRQRRQKDDFNTRSV